MNMSAMMGVGGGRMPDFSAVKEKMFQKADANGDKAVSFEEFQSAGKNMPIGKMGDASKAKEAFGKIDSDGNGSLSQDEMSAFGDKMSSQMQGMMLGMQAMLSSMGQGMGGKMGGASQQSELMQAINAYRQGSGGSGTDLTKKLLEMLGSQKGATGVTA
jgi:Ca2+-binding EF-hand superfamily protein